MTETKPNLFAFLVGINSYPEGIKNLKGALNDVAEVKKYLNEPFVQKKFETVVLEELTDLTKEGPPTKDAIVAKWKEVFGKASMGDVCFFFFAGHGVREATYLSSFKELEIDGKIETLFCADSQKRKQKMPGMDMKTRTTLADKELRYLIHTLSKKGIRVVTIFDCCHSGDNTRSLMGGVPDNARQIGRLVLAPRDYEGFIFSKDFKEESFKGPYLNKVLPLGEHVQFSACRDEELAFETPEEAEERNGVFTTALLKILRIRKGNISFRDLYHQVAQAMPRNIEQLQQPQFFIPFEESSSRYLEFLTFQPMGATRDVGVVYKEDLKIWSLPLGHLHGIFEKTQVNVFPSQDPKISMAARIDKIFLTHTDISFTPHADFARDSYLAHVKGLAIKPLIIGMADATVSTTTDLDLLKEKIGALTQGPESLRPTGEQLPIPIKWATEGESLDYEVSLHNNNIEVCRPGDTRPVIQPLYYLPDASYIENISKLRSEFQQMAQWHYFKELDSMNNLNSDREFPLELRLFQCLDLESGEEIEILPKNGNFTCYLTEGLKAEEDPQGLGPHTHFRLELKNVQEQAYSASLLYLSMDYGISIKMMEEENKSLGMGESLCSKKYIKDQYIRYRFSKATHIILDDWPCKEDYLKIIVSNESFNIGDFQMDSLPMRGGKKRGGGDRNIDGEEKERKLSPFEPYWRVRTYGLRVLNPKLNPLPCEYYVDEAKKQACIETRKTE